MDGCGDIQYFIRIALPISTALIAVMFLLAIVQKWNAYFIPLIYLRDPDKFPLQLVMRAILDVYTVSAVQPASAEDMKEMLRLAELMKYALIIVASLPVLIFYPFIQRYFVKGIMLGSIKG
jgi:putative aldouronate transport system permease protein